MAGVWSGYLTFGLVTMPVRLFSGARGERVSFHMLHDADHVRLKQQMICPADKQVVGRDHTVRGYEFAKGEYVIVSEEEIRQAAPQTQKQMSIVSLCRAEEVDPLWYEASYYLVPETAGRKAYALLLEALDKNRWVALVQLSMHNREYLSLLRPTHLAGVPADEGGGNHRGGLMLHTLYYGDEVRVAENFGSAEGAKASEAELRLAHQLLEGMLQPFDPKQFEDRYRKNLEALVEAKVEGRAPALPAKPAARAPVVDLMEALKRSLAESPGREARPAARAGRAQPVAAEKKSPARVERKPAARSRRGRAA